MNQQSNIRQNYDKTSIYETLVDEHGVFGSYIDFFVFAACLGYARGEAKRTEYEGEQEILWMHFGNKDLYRAVAAAVAYQDTGDPESLVEQSVQLEIIAQYAAAGAEIAEQEFGDIAADPTNAVLNYIEKNHDPATQADQETIFNDIMASFDETRPTVAEE